jgi:hypothetical protein
MSIPQPKIAVYFAGLMRNLRDTVDFWQPWIQAHQMDVYGSFWECDEEDKVLFEEAFQPRRVEYENPSDFQPMVDLYRQTLRAPVDLDWNTQCYVNEGRTWPQFYKLWRATRLVNQNSYDIVVRARIDTRLESYPELVVDPHLTLPTGIVGVWPWQDCWGPCDLYHHGSQQLNTYATSLFLHLMDYLRAGEYFFPPENLWRVHLSQKEISLNFLLTKIWMVHRSTEIHYSDWTHPPWEGLVSSLDFRRPVCPCPDSNGRDLRFYHPTTSL